MGTKPSQERQAGVEVEVTPEMEEAGVFELVESGRLFTDYEMSEDQLLVRRIFLNMLSAHSDETRR